MADPLESDLGPKTIDMTPSPAGTFSLYAFFLRSCLTDRNRARTEKKLRYIISEMDRYSKQFDAVDLDWSDIESAMRMAAQKKGDTTHES